MLKLNKPPMTPCTCTTDEQRSQCHVRCGSLNNVTMNHNKDVCANCGGIRGLHNYHNQRCPLDINSNADHTEYRNTVFELVKDHDRDIETLALQLQIAQGRNKDHLARIAELESDNKSFLEWLNKCKKAVQDSWIKNTNEDERMIYSSENMTFGIVISKFTELTKTTQP